MLETIAHYRVLRRLGAGGMGEVYLAEDTRLRRRVALKLLPESLSADRDRLERLVHEARLASALNHPNIVTIYEVAHEDAAAFIATEFIDGHTLRELTPLGLRESIDVTIQVTEALETAHRSGIIHRDLKPANIMRRSDHLVKVLDFGIAKRVLPASDEDPTTFKTAEGVIVGTVRYMSPEQLRGDLLDHRTDVFSLGLVLFELLTGEHPFLGETAQDVAAAILLLEPATIGSFLSTAPPMLESHPATCAGEDARRSLLIDGGTGNRPEAPSEISR